MIEFDGYVYDTLSDEIWADNYKQHDENTREDTWNRAAREAASLEKEEIRPQIVELFREALYNDGFVPGGRILANLGNKTRKSTTMFNCYVHNPHDIQLKDCDSLDGIYDMLKAQAKTLKSEGGYGINASWIRPSGSYVTGIGSRTPGPLKFMELWDKSSEIITSGSTKMIGSKRLDEKSKIRKGAQMLVLNVWHPDIKEFIVAKQNSGVLSKFNVSVGITEGFIDAVKNNLDWQLKFPDTEYEKYSDEWFGFIEDWESKGYPVIVYETVKARDIWDLILTATYNRAEPGVLFLDLANKLNPLYYADKIATTNPCGEIPQSTGVCNIGSINLTRLVKEVDGKLVFDNETFKKRVEAGIRFLDNINDLSSTPLPEYDRSVREKRRIGLGVMGLGSLHIMLGIKYGSEESIELQTLIAKTKAETELLTSAKLGKEKGSFELFDAEKYFNSYYFTNLDIDPEVKKKIVKIGCMRNSHQSMNAPTGNTGIYARNVSGGIEPVFDNNGYIRWCIVPEFRRRLLTEQGLKIPDVSKGDWFETDVFKFSTRGDEQILKGDFDGHSYEIDKSRGLTVENNVEDYSVKFAKKYYGDKFETMKSEGKFASVPELKVEDHINSLKVWAKFTNMAISKTINLPNDYSYEAFKNAYMYAWDNNIKGITAYREGTMTAVLESKSNQDANKEAKTDKFLIKTHDAPKRPTEVPCDIHQVKIKGESWTIFIGKDSEGNPFEIFGGYTKYIQIPKAYKTGVLTKKGKKSDMCSQYDLTYGDEGKETIIKDIVSVFENPLYNYHTRSLSMKLRHGISLMFIVDMLQKDELGSELYSFNKVIARVLKSYIPDGTKKKGKCPNCGSEDLVLQEGCFVCRECSYSKCS